MAVCLKMLFNAQEEQANLSMAKYRKLQAEYQDAEERADAAQTALSKVRAKQRGALALGGAGGGSASVVSCVLIMTSPANVAHML